MTAFEDLDELGAEFDALEGELGAARDLTAAFGAELNRMQSTMAATQGTAMKLDRTLSTGVSRAINGVVLDGIKMSDALRTVAQSMIDVAWKNAIRPVSDHISSALVSGASAIFGEFSPFEKGGSFAQGRVMPFAKGGVVSGPAAFPMRGGRGLMGEAGPEAIMPLTRGPDGSLGVRAAGGGGAVQITMNIQTPDVQGFQRSQSQIAARMSRALGAAARNR